MRGPPGRVPRPSGLLSSTRLGGASRARSSTSCGTDHSSTTRAPSRMRTRRMSGTSARIFHSKRPGSLIAFLSSSGLRQLEALRDEADLPLAVFDAWVDEDAHERAEEAVARPDAALSATGLDQPAPHVGHELLRDGI